jgi:hypothetical protein
VLTNFEPTNTEGPVSILRKLFHGLKYQLFYMFDFTIQQITTYQDIQNQLQHQIASLQQQKNEPYRKKLFPFSKSRNYSLRHHQRADQARVNADFARKAADRT